jgi:virulence factor Mce-like protein
MRRRLAPFVLPLRGLAFLVVLVGLVAASIVDYTGGFTPSTSVTLVVDDAGSQLARGAQVKLRGAVVGTVERVEPSSEGARLTLALQPEDTDLIPTNTVARILPKTLVGQDYVDLVVPSVPSGRTVTEGDEISRDTSAVAASLEGALDNLLEVLQAVPPQQVASTLNAVSTALEGRGEQLGTTLVSLQEYVEGLNPAVPGLTRDLRELVQFSETYSEAAPELLEALDSLTTTAQTISEQRDRLARLFTTVADGSEDLGGFLGDNEENLVALADVSRPTLDLLAEYSPQFPCLLGQLAGLVPRVDEIFGKGDARPALSIVVRVTNSRGKYLPNQDEPAYLDTRGPRCYEIKPIAPQFPESGGPIRDGSTVPPPATPLGSLPTVPGLPGLPQLPGLPTTGGPGGPGGTILGGISESDLVEGLLGGGPDAGSTLGSLLLAPILRGSQVSLR